jgi:D-arabinan exo alpha-(1,3)/(1,5)-arabinofuranosidase (non-reducing end)
MKRHVAVVCLILIAAVATVSAADGDALSQSFFSDMVQLRDSTSARMSSYDQSGGNGDSCTILPGQTLELAGIPGAGCIRHVYFTVIGQEHYLRDMVLRMYWDGETDPSVEAPFGDFFGLGHEQPRFFQSLLVCVNPGTGVVGTFGFNSYFPMPFADGARLTLTNEGVAPVGVWYHIDYEKLDKLDGDVARFHAQWHRENPTTAVGEQKNVTIHGGVNLDGKENYVILDAEGHGNVVGYFLNVDNVAAGQHGGSDDTWYGEGDDMIFIDGEQWPPSLHGTGSEEIFGGGACPNQEYTGPYTGYHIIGNRDYLGKMSMYRFFVADPIRFRKSVRVTVEHGHANNMANDYSSCAFWYQSEPHKPFPPLPPAPERRPRVGSEPRDAAYREVQRLQEGALASLASLTVTDIQEALSPELMRALEDRDYETAIKECQEGLLLLQKLLEDHAAQEGK